MKVLILGQKDEKVKNECFVGGIGNTFEELGCQVEYMELFDASKNSIDGVDLAILEITNRTFVDGAHFKELIDAKLPLIAFVFQSASEVPSEGYIYRVPVYGYSRMTLVERVNKAFSDFEKRRNNNHERK